MTMETKERDPRTYAIIGAAMEVHKDLGPGFLEAVYQEAMEMEMTDKGIPFESQPELSLFFKDRPTKKKYRPDFRCHGSIIVEIKAQKCLTLDDQSQLLNAMNASKLKLGLLINFGEASLVFKRFIK